MSRSLARAFVFAWFFIGGVTHFLLPNVFVLIVPPYIPYALIAVYISGALELIGASMLLIPSIRHHAGTGLIILTILVTPANIYMLQIAEQFPKIPEWALIVRLPFQLVLIGLIWWSSRNPTFANS